jgi:putative sigma-54 modulation protein
MKADITFRHIEATEGLRAHVEERLARLEKHVHRPIHARAVLQVDRHQQRAEIHVQVGDMNVHAEEITDDMYVAIDKAAEKVEHQLRKKLDKKAEHRVDDDSL